MRTVMAVAIGALALAGCGKSEPGKPRTADEVIAAADNLVKPLPGLYRSTARVVEFEVPGIPPQQAAMLKDRMAGAQGMDHTQCLTQAQANEGFKPVVRNMGEGREGVKCEFSKFDAAGSQLDATMTCSGAKGTEMAMDIAGTVKADGTDMTMAMDQSSPMVPGGKMHIKMHVTSQRIGDCK